LRCCWPCPGRSALPPLGGRRALAASEQFCYFDYPIRDLAGQTLGILGSGTLGDGVARLAEAFGMRVIRGERKGADTVREGYVAFPQLSARPT
jgi:glycerate dehydrogenase